MGTAAVVWKRGPLPNNRLWSTHATRVRVLTWPSDIPFVSSNMAQRPTAEIMVLGGPQKKRRINSPGGELARGKQWLQEGRGRGVGASDERD